MPLVVAAALILRMLPLVRLFGVRAVEPVVAAAVIVFSEVATGWAAANDADETRMASLDKVWIVMYVFMEIRRVV